MSFLRKSILLAISLASYTAGACETGNFVPVSGSNELYYVDTTSHLPLAIVTYWFGADCTQPIAGQLIGPGNVITSCYGYETGDNTASNYYCQPLDRFVDGQYQVQWLGNSQQFNQFRVTTNQATVLITPTVTVVNTPTSTITTTTTSTETDTSTTTIGPVTVPATTSVLTISITPSVVTTTTTKTTTKTVVTSSKTLATVTTTVTAKCIYKKPLRSSNLGKHPRDFPVVNARVLAEARAADEYDARRALVDRQAVPANTVSWLQNPTTTVTETTYTSTSTVQADSPTTTTTTSQAVTTVSTTSTLDLGTVSVGTFSATQTTTLIARTTTRKTTTTSSKTTTRMQTITVHQTMTVSPGPSQIKQCYKQGGHYVY